LLLGKQEELSMIKKLFAIAALVFGVGVAASAPAPAIDFICSCTVCAGGTGPGCRDLKAGHFTSCSSWWATYGSHCP
jgi:hypothetical protein